MYFYKILQGANLEYESDGKRYLLSAIFNILVKIVIDRNSKGTLQ
jgi:hypothetical protein